MNEELNRARVRSRSESRNESRSESRSELYPVRPETALIGWSAAVQAGLADRSGPQTDHLAALVCRARRREARRRFLRGWLPQRSHRDARQHHPAGRRITDQKNRETATALEG